MTIKISCESANWVISDNYTYSYKSYVNRDAFVDNAEFHVLPTWLLEILYLRNIDLEEFIKTTLQEEKRYCDDSIIIKNNSYLSDKETEDLELFIRYAHSDNGRCVGSNKKSPYNERYKLSELNPTIYARMGYEVLEDVIRVKEIEKSNMNNDYTPNTRVIVGKRYIYNMNGKNYIYQFIGGLNLSIDNIYELGKREILKYLYSLNKNVFNNNNNLITDYLFNLKLY